MASIDIIGELRSFAQAKGWHFVYGNDQYANYEAGRFKYEPGDLILIADLNLSPTYGSGGGIDGLTFTGGIMLGQSGKIRPYPHSTRRPSKSTMQG